MGRVYLTVPELYVSLETLISLNKRAMNEPRPRQALVTASILALLHK